MCNYHRSKNLRFSTQKEWGPRSLDLNGKHRQRSVTVNGLAGHLGTTTTEGSNQHIQCCFDCSSLCRRASRRSSNSGAIASE